MTLPNDPADASGAAKTTDPQPVSRRWLLGAVGAAAVAAGALWSWRQRQHPSAASVNGGGAQAPSGVDLDGFWKTSFPTPDGKELLMRPYLGHPLVLNFWAPWCPPCVRELPLLNEFYLAHRRAGWQVLGLAIDGPTPVREFLAHRPLSYAVGLAGFGGTELMQALGNREGGLPYTIVVDSSGRIVDRVLGPTEASNLARWLKTVA